MQRTLTVALVAWLMVACVGATPNPGLSDQAAFEQLLEKLALGWNTNNASLAAAAFTVDASYVEPPAKQRYVGREAIFQFFGGPDGRPSWMRMTWHNISFNPARQTGAGEFTFAWEGGQVHGMVSMKLKGGLIHRWREYFYESNLPWGEFQRPSSFDE